MQLSKILKGLCEERGITISALAKRTGVPQQTLHNWVAGVEPRSLTQVKKVADFFEVTFDYLCFGRETKKPDDITSYKDEINAGVFEVVLRRVKRKS
jgi:transcriptional regulator with XRE-family HTH domain